MIAQRLPAAHQCRLSSRTGVARIPQLARQQLRKHSLKRVAAEESGAVTQEALDDQVEAFMKRQAELESGAAFARTKDPSEIIGADVVDEENAKALCREVVRILRTLKSKRDMTVNEARLIVSIEDPRTREQRQLGIEDERGVSRDEMAAALLDVAEGRVPKDRLALKCLVEEMQGWPFLGEDGAAAAAEAKASVSGGGSSSSNRQQRQDEMEVVIDEATGIAKPYIMSSELRKGEQPQTLADMLPDWVGYGTLYGISIIPVLIVVATVVILFYNSLK